jgi:uncharacterized NAD(P)/FAD-binding protein YdhS
MKRITIIGGGATGTLLAVNLVRNAGDQPVLINIVEKNERFGLGVAYSTVQDYHVLNVPAGKMGAFPDDVEHFHKWLGDNGHDFKPSDFVPRRLYGEYLRKLFWETYENRPSNVTVNLFSEEAIDILFKGDEAEVWLNSGTCLRSDKVVLAFGNFPPPPPRTEDPQFLFSSKYFANPWNNRIGDTIKDTDDVFIIGTGLTMVDTALGFYHRYHKGKIFAASRHGLLPATHKLGFSYPSFETEIDGQSTVRSMLKTVRNHIKAAESGDGDWRGVIDSLRPFTQKAWMKLALPEKLRFMRHLKHFWNTARHRIAPECAEVLYRMQWTDQLHIKKGKIKGIHLNGNNKFHIDVGPEHLEADVVINCTGSESDFSKVEVPLVQNLLTKGAIKTDPLSLGLEADPRGKITENLYTIGTALKGVMWESTAMPELRAQARELALEFLQTPAAD